MTHTNFQRQMPCGFVKTPNLAKNIRHYCSCHDAACVVRCKQWLATIKTHTTKQAATHKTLINIRLPKAPESPALDNTKTPCSIKNTTNQTAVNQTAGQPNMKKATKTAKAKKPAKAAKKAKRLDTGYVAAIRSLLQKQKYTITKAAEKIKEEFPDKDLKSIKRIMANVAKRMRQNPDTPDIRWLPGANINTGYMARIDELLRGGKHTTRQIGETVAKEFDKNPVSAKKVVRARLKRMRDAGDKTVRPLLEADIREAKPAKAKKVKATPKAAKKATGSKVAKGLAKLNKKAKKSAAKAKPAPVPTPETLGVAA